MRFFYIPYIVFCIILVTQFIINVSDKPEMSQTVTEEKKIDIYFKSNLPAVENIKKDFFTLKAKDNKVYLYNQNDEIVQILNIDYSSLREYDKNQFNNGIKANNMQEVYSLIEDFTN